ncbi:metal-dependent hydrolase [Rubrivirga sp.]|uniref:metal-dependent hydrolase n=1 Tax=Rubrivirga sp. TaxID=1885344 RepID=UPI003C717E72
MDSLTQAVLGGAVGHAVAGKTLGRRAAAWGAVAGTLPDLDVLTYPFLDTAGQLLIHRGVTHGLAFGLTVGPILGWLGWRFARWRTASRSDQSSRAVQAAASRAAPDAWRAWVALWTLALVTHPLLDTVTIYGTQLLAPFSNEPFALGSLFIIDPMYTVPLLVGLVVGLVRKRPRWAVVGLALSTAYVGWSVWAQQTVLDRATAALPTSERILVTPMPLQTLVWRIEAERDGRVTSYRHAILDPGFFHASDASDPLAEFAPDLEDTRGVETLQWFSRGWLVRPRGADSDVVADARFGRVPGGNHVFRWEISPDGSFEQLPFELSEGSRLFRDLAGDLVSLR